MLLVIAIVALGYSGWIYFDAYWHERRESEAFTKARQGQTSEASPQTFPARLSVPRLRLTTMVEEGVGENTLRRAAGHIPDTALPGQPGNVGVAAHRDMAFRSLSGIREHDRIVMSTLKRDYDYEVVSTSIVNPDDVGVLAPSRGQQTLTLITCYPFYFIGHAPKRFVVRARQIDGNGRGMQDLPAKEQPARVKADAPARMQANVENASLHRTDLEAETPEADRISSAAQSAPLTQEQAGSEKAELRLRLLEQLKRVVVVQDTPRGLVATVRDPDFTGAMLREMAANQVTRIGAIVSAYPGLRVAVEGHTDSAGAEALSEGRAEAVRGALVGNGLRDDAVAARGLGNTRPLVSNASAAGRQTNRRVEIVISGEPIGSLALWDRSYTLMRQ
jgi:LPXTG-site transpeptidase (sortase) family protein